MNKIKLHTSRFDNQMIVTMERNFWKQSEINLLNKCYENETQSEIMKKIPNRNWKSIKEKAQRCGLCYSFIDHRNSDLSILLNDSNQTLYWIGFLMADGSINFKTYRLTLGLAEKDLGHLQQFSNYIKTNNLTFRKKTNSYTINVQDKINIPKIIDKYGFKRSKTYNPPDISILENLNKDQFLSLVVGYIDGDGCIKNQYNRKDYILTIKSHSSWLPILQYITKRIYSIYDIELLRELAKINNSGYAQLNITRNSIIRSLKMTTLNLDVPYLKRKWDIIAI